MVEEAVVEGVGCGTTKEEGERMEVRGDEFTPLARGARGGRGGR